MNSTLRKQCIFCCCENICRTLIRNRSPKGQFKRKKQREYCLNFSLIRLFRRLSHSLHLQHCNFHSPYLALVLQCSTLNWWRICLQTIQSETKAKQKRNNDQQMWCSRRLIFVFWEKIIQIHFRLVFGEYIVDNTLVLTWMKKAKLTYVLKNTCHTYESGTWKQRVIMLRKKITAQCMRMIWGLSFTVKLWIRFHSLTKAKSKNQSKSTIENIPAPFICSNLIRKIPQNRYVHWSKRCRSNWSINTNQNRIGL